MKAIIMAIFWPLLLTGDAWSQKTKSEKNAQAVNTALQTMDALAKIIKSKKQKSSDSTTGAATSKPEKAGALKAGDIAPNAKYLDIDKFYPFNDGAAVVMKGGSTALIDTGGNLIVPFNKYDIRSPVTIDVSLGTNGAYGATEVWTPTGLFKLVNQNKYINSKGQLINGKEPPYNDLAERLAKKGYTMAGSGSEGLICVYKTDAYGTAKFGFVDSAGREMISPMYSNKPTDFKNGFARVEPKDHSEFLYGFINRQGKLVIKITEANNYGFKEFTYQGYAFSGEYMMDTTGKIIQRFDFLKQFGINDRTGGTIVSLEDQKGKFKDRKFRIVARDLQTNDNRNIQGYIDLKTKKLVGFPFSGHPPIYFDEKAKLAYAEVHMGFDKAGAAIVRQGYINEEGIFVIVKAKAASQW
ncbi:MAG: WG repeat-containing protein [Williamsia sp.]|nr:WG repeat-containing protein [Williamsia sp.]